jgi:small subunit ribosomal protein S13
MRVAGVSIPKDKQVRVALTYIYGIGRTSAVKILVSAKVAPETRVKNLTQAEEDAIRSIVEKTHKTEGDLRRDVAANIKRLKDIKAYRGVRHMRRH